MRIIAQFVKSINLFQVLDQIFEDDNILDEKYNALANVLLPVIDQAEEEVTYLDTITCTLEQRNKVRIDEKIVELQEYGIEITYGELKDEVESEIDSNTIVGSSSEASKSPLVTKSKKRKDAVEWNPKKKVYSIKSAKGQPSKKEKRMGTFVLEIPTIQEEEPLHEEEEEAKLTHPPPPTINYCHCYNNDTIPFHS